jgi:two-component system response regulator MprA
VSAETATLLVVEDERLIGHAVAQALRNEGHQVAIAADGPEALRLAAALQPAGVVLDVMLPGLDGLEVCRRLRSSGSTVPVLLLTARDHVEDRVAGLDAGADDYLVKPFSVAELKARVRALLRRDSWRRGEQPLHVADLELRGGVAVRSGREISLTATEYRLLRALMTHPGELLTRDALMDGVWGFDAGSNALDVYVGYLRRKLEAGGEPRLIHTVRGIGFRLGDP